MQPPLVRFAQFYATIKHAGQTYGALPYTHHLQEVANVAHEFRGTTSDETHEVLVSGCWLHDVMEDAGVKYKDLYESFGEAVANVVYAVTDEPGDSRKIRKALTYPKIREEGWVAIRLKLCDRIANVRRGGPLFEMYRDEHEEFRRALYISGVNDPLWKELDRLFGAEND